MFVDKRNTSRNNNHEAIFSKLWIIHDNLHFIDNYLLGSISNISFAYWHPQGKLR